MKKSEEIRAKLGPLRQRRNKIRAEMDGLDAHIAELATREAAIITEIEDLEVKLIQAQDSEQ